MTFMTEVVRDALSQEWWAALREGKLLLQRDPATGRTQWYPRGHCLDDLQRSAQWIEASGLGTVYSFSVIHRGNVRLDGPYICALIELKEGVLMLSQLRNIDVADVRVGMSVRVGLLQVDDETVLPVFEPWSNA